MYYPCIWQACSHALPLLGTVCPCSSYSSYSSVHHSRLLARGCLPACLAAWLPAWLPHLLIFANHSVCRRLRCLASFMPPSSSSLLLDVSRDFFLPPHPLSFYPSFLLFLPISTSSSSIFRLAIPIHLFLCQSDLHSAAAGWGCSLSTSRPINMSADLK
jgi:hypothetical protein